MNKCGKEWIIMSEHELRYMYPYGIIQVPGGYQYINRAKADMDNDGHVGHRGRAGRNIFQLSEGQKQALYDLGLNNGLFLYDNRTCPWDSEKMFDRYFNLLYEVRKIVGHE